MPRSLCTCVSECAWGTRVCSHTHTHRGPELRAVCRACFPGGVNLPGPLHRPVLRAAKMCLHLALAEPREGGGRWGRLAKHCPWLSPDEGLELRELSSFLLLRSSKMFFLRVPISPSPSSFPLPQGAGTGSDPAAPQGSPRLPAGRSPYGFLQDGCPSNTAPNYTIPDTQFVQLE